jgi:hypothetical protein
MLPAAIIDIDKVRLRVECTVILVTPPSDAVANEW